MIFCDFIHARVNFTAKNFNSFLCCNNILASSFFVIFHFFVILNHFVSNDAHPLVDVIIHVCGIVSHLFVCLIKSHVKLFDKGNLEALYILCKLSQLSRSILDCIFKMINLVFQLD